MARDALKLGALNALWVVIITVNSRVVNRPGATVLAVVGTQAVVSIAYFVIVKQIQRADGAWAKLAYVVGGALGGGAGLLLTTWLP